MIFQQLNTHACQTYLLGDEEASRALLIDPVIDGVDDYLRILVERGLELELVIDTHTHADHISGAAVLKDRTGCRYMLHASAPSPCADIKVSEGHVFTFSSTPIRILHTPGHTKDSVCFILPGILFTGDTLFLDDGGAGRDDLPGGDAGEHWESLEKLKMLPEHLIVCPAHEYRGRKPSTLGEQKARNPHMAHRSKEQFISYSEDLKLGPAEWMKDVLKANIACARDPGAAWIPVDLPACEVKGTLEKSVNEISVKAVSVDVLKSMMERAQKPSILDVREPDELTGPLGHLPGIIHIPITGLPRRLGELQHLRNNEIVTVCRSGSRAHTAAQILARAGFAHAAVLEGGMNAWNASGYPVMR
jgi:sulfur dioxygenase